MRVERLQLRDFRSYETRRRRARPRPDGHPRAQRSRQDEPARGPLLRLHGPLLPDDQRARAGPLRRPRPRASCSTAATRDGAHQLVGRLRAGRAEADDGGRSAPSSGCWTLPHRPLVVRLPARSPGAGQGPAGRCAAPISTRSSPACGRLAPRPGAPTAQALAQRNALISRVRSGACGREAVPPGTSSSRRTGSRCATTERPRSQAARRAFRSDTPRPSGLAARATLAYRPRTQRDVSRGARRRARRASLAGPRARFHRPRPPPRRSAAPHASGRELRAYGSQGEQRLALLALLLAERDALAAERDRPPLMLLDDVMSELDHGRRERLSDELRRGGQALITTTELEHVPGAARRARSPGWRSSGARSSRRSSRREPAGPPAARAGARGARCRGSRRRRTLAARPGASGGAPSAPPSAPTAPRSASATGCSRWPATRPSGPTRSS